MAIICTCRDRPLHHRKISFGKVECAWHHSSAGRTYSPGVSQDSRLTLWYLAMMLGGCPLLTAHPCCVRVLTQTAMRLFKVISPIYTWVFVLVRTCMGPPIIGWLAKRLVLEATKLPVGLRYTATLICSLGRLQIPWITCHSLKQLALGGCSQLIENLELHQLDK